MTHTYKIEGMTCGSCVAKVKDALEKDFHIDHAEVDLQNHTAKVEMHSHLTTQKLQELLSPAGAYSISETQPTAAAPLDYAEPSVQTYRPLILIIAFIAGVSLLAQYPFGEMDGMLWMRHFMAGFFIVFSFFKLLNLRGFADSYAMYDIVAARWRGWGFIYPFVELTLGIAYLINFYPTFTNWATIVVLGISSIGVIQSNLNKRKIKCACLGDVFNLPMSTVTVVEDVGMVLMAITMLIL